jgi:hypothetical protein
VDSPVAAGGAPVPVGEDVSSMVFLHASERPATNNMSYRFIANFADTADLLGWYEVVYEDGYVETVPIRYRVNILSYQNERPDSYCYGADVVNLSATVRFYAFEWKNPRYGKVIREVRLKGTTGMPNNSIVLAALSVVKKRPAPGPPAPPILNDRP